MSARDRGIPLVVVGCDFRVASSRVRSCLARDDRLCEDTAAQLRAIGAADGFLELVTCNRNEWIASAAETGWAGQLMATRMKAVVASLGQSLDPFVLEGEAALRHVLRVAAGRESLVLGERQIAGQLFRALETARARGWSSRVLNGLGTASGRLVRDLDDLEGAARTARGVHSLALSYAAAHRGGSDRGSCAVVGMGAIGRRLLETAHGAGAWDCVAVNRTPVAGLQARLYGIDALAEVLAGVDVAFVCTGAPHRIISREHLRGRDPARPLLIVDIGIPEQAPREDLPSDVRVAGLDDLTSYVTGVALPEERAVDARIDALIDEAVARFEVFCATVPYVDILQTIQSQTARLVHGTIPRIIAERLGSMAPAERDSLERELKSAVRGFTAELLDSVKGTCGCKEEDNGCRCEP